MDADYHRLNEIEIARLRARVAELERELERWRHGQQVEGDYVCPDSLALTELRRMVRETLEDIIYAQKNIKDSRWTMAAANLDDIERALREAADGE